jgi:hypothetical protein
MASQSLRRQRHNYVSAPSTRILSTIARHPHFRRATSNLANFTSQMYSGTVAIVHLVSVIIVVVDLTMCNKSGIVLPQM